MIPLWPDVGRALGLHRTATQNARRRGELPFPVYRISGRDLVPTAKVRQFLGLDPEPQGEAARGGDGDARTA